MATKCPTPTKSGACGCPTSESRCRGWVREMQDRWDEVRESGKTVEEAAAELADYRWSERDLLIRFGAR